MPIKALMFFGLAIAVSLTSLAGVMFGQNYKIKQKVTMQGQTSESTVYVRGPRKRTEGGGVMGMGGDVTTVEQCDLKQNLKISDTKKMYAIEPFETDSAPATPPPTGPTNSSKPAPKTRGGTVTYVSNTTDTGERKQMFGVTARHIKTSMSVESSPDACAQQNMKMESDGWYIDLPEFSCPAPLRPQVPSMGRPSPAGCRDRVDQRTTGNGGKLGFALTETRTMSMGDAGMSFTQSTETVEFSKAPLDAALFDIPQGYAKTNNSQDLYGKPDIAALMRNMGGDDDSQNVTKPKNNPSTSPPTQNTSSGSKKPGTVRIGVLVPTNKSGENVSTTNLQGFLVQQLSNGNVEAVAVGSEGDARSSSCDYLLSSDFSKLKLSTAAKIGGMFGKVTNSGVSGNYDTQVDYRLVSLSTGQAVLTNKAASKSETNVDSAAESVLAIEAAAVKGSVSH